MRVAQAVAPDGSVLGLDVSAPLAGLAQQRAAAAGIDNLEVLVADAQTADLADRGPFHLLVSRFGVMFFDDPTAAFTSLRRSLAPGGRLAFVCWKGYEVNPWMKVPMGAALEHLPPPPMLEPGAPGPWAFADDDRVRAVLEGAGFSDVRLETLEGEVSLAGGGDAEHAYDFLKATSLGRTLLTQEDPTVADRVEGAVLDALRAHETPEGVRLGYAAWQVSARSEG
jgi:SAM-dependent methyltransferase